MTLAIDDWLVINALGGLENPNPVAEESGASALIETTDQMVIDDRAIRDARASGLTAVNITLGYTLGSFPPYEHTVREIAAWDAVLQENSDALQPILRAGDLREAKQSGRIGVIYGFQNTDAIEGRVERIGEFARAGVRVIQLTYNKANAVGGGSLAPETQPLTPLGRDVIAELNAHRVMVDLSHSGRQTCLDAIRESASPISINHTGCRALADLPRNKSDEELRLVAEQGGFVGVYFMPFLDAAGHPTAEDVVEHLVHAVNVCGEDHVGIGTDGSVTSIDDLDAYRVRLAEHVAERQAAGVSAHGERADTFPFVVDLRGVEQFRRLAELLDRRGFTERRIEKIMGANFHKYAEAIWGA